MQSGGPGECGAGRVFVPRRGEWGTDIIYKTLRLRGWGAVGKEWGGTTLESVTGEQGWGDRKVHLASGEGGVVESGVRGWMLASS